MPWRPKKPQIPWRTLLKLTLVTLGLALFVLAFTVIQELRSAPRRARNLRQQAELQLQLGRHAEAAESLVAASALTPDDMELVLQLAQVRRLQGERAEVLRLLGAAHADHPGDDRLTVALARALLDEGRALEAAEALRPTISAIRKLTDPLQRIEVLMTAAQAAIVKGSLLEAEALLREAGRTGPGPVTSVARAAAAASLALVELLMRSGRLDAASEALDHARTLTPWDQRIPAYRAHVLELQGKTEAAIASLQSFTTTATVTPEAARALGGVLVRARRLDEASELVARLEGTTATAPLADELRTSIAVASNDPARMVAEAERLAQAAPRSPTGDVVRGRAALLQGDLDGARAAFEAALKLAPETLEADLALLRLDERQAATPALQERAMRLLGRRETRAWGLRALLVSGAGGLDVAAARLKEQRLAQQGDHRLGVALGLVVLALDRADEAASELTPVLVALDYVTAVAALAETPDEAAAILAGVEALGVRAARGHGTSASRHVIARLLERLDRVALAAAVVEKLEPRTHEVHVLRARLAMRAGDNDRAASSLAAVLEGDASATVVLGALGELALARGDHPRAAELLARASLASPDNAVLAARLGRARAGAGDLAGARAAFAEARRLDPRSPIAYEDGAVALLEGDARRAIDLFREGLERSRDPRHAAALAAALALDGRWTEALAPARLFESASRAPEAAVLGAWLGARGGAPARAVQGVPRAVEQALQRDAPRRATLELVALGALGWREEALARVEVALAEPVADPLALWFALKLSARSAPSRWVAVAERLAAATGEGDLAMALELSAARRAHGEPARALEVLRPFQARLAALPPRSLVELGMGLEALADLTGATACYRATLDREPANVIARNNLACVLLAGGAAADAVVHAQEAVRLAPYSAEVHDTLGWALHLTGDDVGAAPLLERAAARLPGNPTVRFHLAAVQAALGMTHAARCGLDLALALGASWPERAQAETLLDALNRP